jgi:predicted PilT family ATPase
MNDLPRLELYGDPNKNNDYIIYRYSTKTNTMKIDTQKKMGTKKIKNNTKKIKSSIKKKITRNSRKSIFNIF